MTERLKAIRNGQGNDDERDVHLAGSNSHADIAPDRFIIHYCVVRPGRGKCWGIARGELTAIQSSLMNGDINEPAGSAITEF